MIGLDEAGKRRLAGAAVLVALAVIFVPMLVDDRAPQGLGEPIVVPEPPDVAGRLDGVGAPPDDLIPPLSVPEPPADAAVADGSEAAPAGTESAAASGADAASTTPLSPAEGVATEAAAGPVGPKPVPPGVRSWVVQVASVNSAEAAEGLQNKLRGKGYPAFVEQAEVNGRLYFRVRVGPEVDKASADGLAKRLAGETPNKPLVQTYR